MTRSGDGGQGSDPLPLCVHRCNLASVMLQLLAMKVPDVLTFDFMSKPSPGEWSPVQHKARSRQATTDSIRKNSILEENTGFSVFFSFFLFSFN